MVTAGFLFSSLILGILTGYSMSLQHVVNICQNKNCAKQFPGSHDLVSLFQNLMPPQLGAVGDEIIIQSSGCLSQCGSGPNVSIESSASSAKQYGGVNDPQTAAAVLEASCDVVCPPMLIAACTVMAQADAISSASQKEKTISSVISALESSTDPLLNSSRAFAAALIMRADARLLKSPPDISGARGDICKATAVSPENPKAWRVLAEIEEIHGNTADAIIAVRKWSEVDPSFSRKAKNEIARLSLKL